MLRQDEGLVGLVASEANPVNLSEAQTHPAFAFRPETGEEIYHSFLGVPILRAGNTLGVLVVQNRARRTYSEEEEEALQTTAMVMAEMIASGELSSIAKPGAEPAIKPRLHLTGSALSEGIALGHVVLHEPRVTVKNVIADDMQKELKRLDEAIAALRADLDLMLERRDVADGGEHRDVLDAYRSFANDAGWTRRLREAVSTGLTAEAGVERVQSDTRARMLRVTDPYLRDRLHDLDDLANRLMRQLMGQDHAPPREQLPDNAIVVARSMGPAALLDYDRRKLRGLILEEGGPTSHVAIVARALGIAAVGEIDNIAGLVETGDPIIVDGSTGDDASAAAGRHRDRLWRAREAARAPAGAVPRAARQALRHQGRPGDRADDQRRPAGRPAAYRRDRRERHRPVPHRAAVHDRDRDAAHQRAAFALPLGARRRGRQAGDVPHARRRRRQDPALHARRAGGEPGARLARDPARARPARPDAQPDPRAAAGRRRPRAAGDVPDDRDLRRVRRGQRP